MYTRQKNVDDQRNNCDLINHGWLMVIEETRFSIYSIV